MIVFLKKYICNTDNISYFLVYLQSVKNGRFKRARIVKIVGVNPIKYNFVYLKRNLLTINIML